MSRYVSGVSFVVPERKPGEKVWYRHSTGQMMPIKDMHDDHLKAAIAMVTRGYDAYGMKIAGSYDGLLDDLREEAASRKLEVKEEGWDQ
jgi:hypothetical protein